MSEKEQLTEDVARILREDDFRMDQIASLSHHELVSLVQVLRAHGSEDYLTGLLMRAAFERRVERFLERFSQKGGMHGVVAMLDIDFFKKVNDTYGHAVGDTTLQCVAETVAKQVRPTDIVGRYGGEEFVIWMPGTDIAEAQAAANRIREAVSKACANPDGEPITISIGLASTAQCGFVFSELQQAADTALYAAKTGGRNRVSIAEA